ncbi:MAG: UvrD-helicase domain-containing protein [Candidatus Omnitrophota bacterium]|nr:MAG: UvrD-helicase domain-containing protein [Candidatus Omnitrophota bacterium]
MLKIDYTKHLNPEQLKVVMGADEPCLVLAGAGSGKTRTLIYRVAYLLERGVKPDNILLATFTNKAARQMKDRVEMLLRKDVKDLWCGTFHHIGNRILRMRGKHIGIKPDYNIMDQEDARTLIKACLRELKINTKDKFFPAPRVIQSIISYSRNTKENLSNVINTYYPEFLELINDVKVIYSIYTKRKASSNNLDYDDLLTETLRLLNQSQAVRGRFTGQFENILVDEYQDTNKLQFEIIKILSEEHKNILVVGDDAQSIYAFRGATIDNIFNFPKEFPETKIFKLQTNYRSSQDILDLANESINFNRKQYEKDLKSVKGRGEKPILIEVRDLRRQSAFIIQRVLELHDEGYDLKKMAVLFRAHYQSAELEMELLKRGIPYIIRGGIKFFEQAHIKDALSYLRIIQNPNDEIAWMRALSLEQGIGAGFSTKIFKNFTWNCKSLKDIFKDKHWNFLKKKTRVAFEHFRNTMSAVTKDNTYGKIDLMLETVIKTGYEKYCITHFDNYKDRLDDLKELLNFAHTYRSVNKFLADTSLGETFKGETVIEPVKDTSDYLILTTIHQAKGLEWDAVMIIGLIDNQFPHSKSMEDLQQLEEERRLFYVAVTRAKNYLYLIHPMTRYDYNYGNVIARPSVFIEELPHESYEKWETEQKEESIGCQALGIDNAHPGA